MPWVEHRQPRLVLADDFETEAMAAAAEVLSALARTEGRVALVALDRVLVRRVAALLLRAGVALDDETGWKLSTTAAAGQVLARAFGRPFVHVVLAGADAQRLGRCRMANRPCQRP